MTLNKYRKFFVKMFGQRWGLELSPVSFNSTGERYLDRYILYLGPVNLRLHKFYRGDDLRAPHDHPWWFITFPFKSYTEEVEFCGCFPSLPPTDLNGCDIRTGYCNASRRRNRHVGSFRFHYRPAKYRHIVIGRADGSTEPFWTFVIAGSVSNRWGFWPKPDQFVPWREWK